MKNADIERILSLPIHESDGTEYVDKWTQRFRVDRGECPVCHDTWDLKPHQALALEYASQGLGPFCMMGVGTGKTLTAMLMPSAYGIDPEDVIVLVPAKLKAEAERERLHYHYHFDVPKLEYMSYAQLSRAENVEYLLERAPKLIISDEAHKLKNATAARTNRFMRVMRNHAPAFSPMSATFANHSIMEYQHLIGVALGTESPLPLKWIVANRWAKCLDARHKEEADGWDWKHILPVAEWAGLDPDLEGLVRACRMAYEKRLTSSPGVVRTVDMSCDAGLVYIDTPYKSPDVAEAIENLGYLKELPNGEEISTPLHAPAKEMQLGLGFYYYTDWGEDGPDYEWLVIKRNYDMAESAFISRRKRGGIDAPSLVRAMLDAGEDVPRSLQKAWDEWEPVRDKYDLESMRETTWITDDVMDYAVALAESAVKRGHKVLLWAAHDAVANRLEEKGLVVARPGERPGSHPICVVSTWSHSEGLNLQYDYDYNLVLSPPANGSIWEQLIGRTHRMGQPKDKVYVEVLKTCGADHTAWRNALKSARFKATTEKIPQKILTLTDG